MTQANIVGIDLGMGATKVWTSAGGQIVLSQVSVPSSSANEINFAALGMQLKRRPIVVANGTGCYLVGEGAHDAGAPIERLDYERLTGSAEMKALVYGALTSQDISGDVAVFVGLPLGLATGDAASARIAAVKAWLNGAHHWTAGDGRRTQERHLNVEHVGCVSQAHAAYSDWLLNLDGSVANKAPRGGEVGVISVGFNTIELLVLRDNQPVTRFTTGEKLGVRRFLELVNEQRGGLFTLGELDVKLRAGAIDMPAPMAKWTSQVHGHIEREWGDAAKRFEMVLAVGGGSILLHDALQSLFGDRLVESDLPVLSVARGLFKLGTKVMRVTRG